MEESKKIMTDKEKHEKIMTLESEIISLKAMLASEESPIGDWKIAKANEYVMAGLESPYNVSELHTERQNVRDQINAMQAELKELGV